MQLTYPAIITPRLLAGVQIDNAFISIDYSAREGREGRTRYQFHIDIADDENGQRVEHSDDDLQSGCQGGSLREGLESLLSFLSACGESVNHATRTGRAGENADLFPPAIAEWAAQHSDEIAIAALEVEETPDCILE
jgi:hypothetical protein